MFRRLLTRSSLILHPQTCRCRYHRRAWRGVVTSDGTVRRNRVRYDSVYIALSGAGIVGISCTIGCALTTDAGAVAGLYIIVPREFVESDDSACHSFGGGCLYSVGYSGAAGVATLTSPP